MSMKSEEYKKLVSQYISGNLSKEEAAVLEDALKSNLDLKRELEEGLQIKKAFHELEKEVDIPATKIFEKVCSQIALNEPEKKEDKVTSESGNIFSNLTKKLRGLYDSPGLAWGICGVQAVILVFAFFMFNTSQPRFETMTLTQNKDNAQYNVIFKSDAKFNDILLFLGKHKIKIIDGPSRKGLFVIRIQDKKDVNEIKKSSFIQFLAPAY